MNASVSAVRNVRPPVTIPAPSIWADTFSKSSFDEQVQRKYAEAIEKLKQEVRGKLMAEATPIKQMIFIDTLERLGLAYHFETEIEQTLQDIYDNDNIIGDCHLSSSALGFRLLRQHQHHVSCNVFNKFLDKDGKFEGDVDGLLSLYEAAHVRFRDEKILEEAERFTRHELSCMESQLQSPLKERVKRGLERPFHREVPITYTRHFISIYESDDSMEEQLLKLAKFNFNFLQNMYKKELYELYRWWNKFDLKRKLPYIRDRVVEAYLWGVGYHYEPQYSYVRKGIGLSIMVIGVVDDTYDNYATVNEAQLFTEALDRWSINEADGLPDYMKIVLHFVMSAYEEHESNAQKKGKEFASYYFKETIQQLGTAYNQELKWFMGKQLPPFQEYLKNSEVTSTIHFMFASVMPGLKSLTQEVVEWIKSGPSFAIKAGLIGRYWDDISTHERESKGGEMLTVADCYMKEYGVSREEAISKFAEAVEDAWKDVNEGWVATTCMPKEIAVVFLNHARVCDATYTMNNEDGFNDPSVSKPTVTSLFLHPIVI